MFFTYDENGRVLRPHPPPIPAPGTPGEFVGTAAIGFDTRPLGLGFRVPMLVVSRFSRGGFVARHT
jgi:phospholipase C